MRPYNCMIVDDEPQAIDLLQDMITTLYSNIIEIGDCCTQWGKAIDILSRKKFDLLFLDISMQGHNSIDLIKAMPGIQSEIIFITAHEDYAIEAFKIMPAGYIVKPVDPLALKTAVDKTLKRIQYKRLATESANPIPFSKIGIPNNNAIDYVNVSDIIYLEAKGSYTNVALNDRVICSSYNMHKFKQSLSDNYFFQIHRSYIINIGHIIKYQTSGIVFLTNSKQLPVSRNLREDFLGLLNRIKVL